jgi:hypothetical protein
MVTGKTESPPKRRKVALPLSRQKVVVIGMRSKERALLVIRQPDVANMCSQALDTSGQAFVR